MQYSSVSKGENLQDTILTIGSYSDFIVLRSEYEGDAKTASEVSQVPVINAGDGAGEHPTQALLDLRTIYKNKETLKDLKIVFVGDIANGRTVHSLGSYLESNNQCRMHPMHCAARPVRSAIYCRHAGICPHLRVVRGAHGNH